VELAFGGTVPRADPGNQFAFVHAAPTRRGAGGRAVKPMTQRGLEGLRDGGSPRAGALLEAGQGQSDRHAAQEAEQERGERADQEVFCELSVLEGLEPRQRLRCYDEAQGTVLA